jgi:hypothetical protein
MIEGISNDYIFNAIKDLYKCIGIKESIISKRLETLLYQNKVKQCIKEIANSLSLPIDIEIEYVPKDYKPNSQNKFHTQNLSKTDESGKGIESITAQVLIPHNLPLFGSTALENLTITVKVSENCCDYPTTFIVIMVHELSHILLESLRHPSRSNEIYVDLTAMMLGFSGIVERGRKVVKENHFTDHIQTQTTTYGYLNDEQFIFAFNKIEQSLKKARKRNNKFKKLINSRFNFISKFDSNVVRFKEFINYLDNHKKRIRRKNDYAKVVEFHSPGYLLETENAIEQSKKLLLEAKSLIKSNAHYMKWELDKIKNYSIVIGENFSKLKTISLKLKKDISVLRRNLDFFYVLKYEYKIYAKGIAFHHLGN